jgi:ribosomal protein S18 acetylase RimI-like enzyme
MSSINYVLVNQKSIKNKSIDIMAKIIFNNFPNLAKFSILKHTIDDIKRLLTSENLVMFVAYLGKKLIGYIVGEFMVLDDKRKILFISYFYVGEKYRGCKVGSHLLDLFIGQAIQQRLDGVLLIVDTQNTKIMNYYFMKQFMYDVQLRRYARHEILFLSLNY